MLPQPVALAGMSATVYWRVISRSIALKPTAAKRARYSSSVNAPAMHPAHEDRS
jgi:hypothetical protein